MFYNILEHVELFEVIEPLGNMAFELHMQCLFALRMCNMFFNILEHVESLPWGYLHNRMPYNKTPRELQQTSPSINFLVAVISGLIA
jgi:hypothetical protein